jgi:hypothetical protein
MRPFLRPPWPSQTQLLRWHPRAPQRNPRRIATTSADNAAPVDVPRLILSPGSPNHDSLPSFLAYAKRRQLAPESAQYVGLHYEYTTALALLRLGFSFLRCGKKNDAGIDLIGHWVLPPLLEPLRVIAQCKARNASVAPCNVRELEGSFQGTPADWKKTDVLGLLITTHRATKGTMKAIGESRWPLGFVMISKEGCVRQLVWNRAASDRGLQGVGVTLRHTPRAGLPDCDLPAKTDVKPSKSALKFRTSGTEKDILLTWLGTPIFPDRDDLDPETLKLMRRVRKKRTPIPTLMNGETPAIHRDPEPLGGRVKGTRGRPRKVVFGETKPTTTTTTPVKRPVRVGRPPGSKNKPKFVEPIIPEIKGRPKVSRTKPKLVGEAMPKVRGRQKGSTNRPSELLGGAG